MVIMYILVTVLVAVTIWSLSENDKAHQTTTPRQESTAQQDQPEDPWQRVQRRLDRGCGTAVLPDLVINGEIQESILAINDQGAFIFVRTPGRPWVEVAHEDVPSSDYVRWAKARWTAMGSYC